MRKLRLARSLGLGLSAATCLLADAPATAATYIGTVVASGLNNPRDLAFGPDGALYIAETGFRGTGFDTGSTINFQANGSVTRLDGSTQTRIVTGLSSLYNSALNDVIGVNGIAFDGAGMGYLAMGLGADPNIRPAGSQFGHILTFTAGGSTTSFADVAAFELANNPLGGPLDSNPFHLAYGSGGLFVTDAGANTVYSVSGSGDVSLVSTFPDRPIGPPLPVSNVVPTGVAVGADGTLYVAELTGFPFTPGAAQIYSIAPGGGTPDVFATGFTNLTDLAFSPDGDLYALSLDTDGILGPNQSGAIYRIGSDGSSQQIYSGLVNPTGMTFGDDGAIYVTNFGNTLDAGLGEVVRISAVPEPASWAMMLIGFALVGQVTRRKKRPALPA